MIINRKLLKQLTANWTLEIFTFCWLTQTQCLLLWLLQANSKLDLHTVRASGHTTGDRGVERTQGQTESQRIFPLLATSCVIYHHYYLLNAHMTILAYKVGIFSWHSCMGHFHCSSCQEVGKKNIFFLTDNGVDSSLFCLQVKLK